MSPVEEFIYTDEFIEFASMMGKDASECAELLAEDPKAVFDIENYFMEGDDSPWVYMNEYVFECIANLIEFGDYRSDLERALWSI